MWQDAWDLEMAHRHSFFHRDEVLRSERCGCFYCQRTFTPAEVRHWVDEEDGVGMTALCPHCGIDAVIGSASGLPLTPEFLTAMKRRWFRTFLPARRNGRPRPRA